MLTDLLLEKNYIPTDEKTYKKVVIFDVCVKDDEDRIVYKNKISFDFIFVLTDSLNDLKDYYFKPSDIFRCSVPQDLDVLDNIRDMYTNDVCDVIANIEKAFDA